MSLIFFRIELIQKQLSVRYPAYAQSSFVCDFIFIYWGGGEDGQWKKKMGQFVLH